MSKRFRTGKICVYCYQVGKIARAEITDHIKPHKGNYELFWDESNWQPLCKACHDSVKAKEESRGYAQGCGADGMPLDSNHFWNEEG
jgi:5-methylcytosine-specific restriction endonuclease McrA